MQVKEQQQQQQPTKIGFDDANYQRYLAIEKDLFSLKDDFVRLSEQSIGIGKLDNLKQLLESPSHYLVTKYQELWLADRPKHLDFTMIFETDTRVKIMRLDDLNSRFWNLHKSMSIHAPMINAKAMTSNLNRSSFDIILDESKKDHYNALKSFFSSVTQLQNYSGNIHKRHFVQAIPELLFDGLDMKINTSLFRK
jgi:hypothetical protein